MDDIEIKRVLAFESELHSYLKDKHDSLLANLEANKAMDKDAEAELTAGLTAFKKTFA
jgi:F-type H+-transporting ATPase subunit alpha